MKIFFFISTPIINIIKLECIKNKGVFLKDSIDFNSNFSLLQEASNEACILFNNLIELENYIIQKINIELKKINPTENGLSKAKLDLKLINFLVDFIKHLNLILIKHTEEIIESFLLVDKEKLNVEEINKIKKLIDTCETENIEKFETKQKAFVQPFLEKVKNIILISCLKTSLSGKNSKNLIKNFCTVLEKNNALLKIRLCPKAISGYFSMGYEEQDEVNLSINESNNTEDCSQSLIQPILIDKIEFEDLPNLIKKIFSGEQKISSRLNLGFVCDLWPKETLSEYFEKYPKDSQLKLYKKNYFSDGMINVAVERYITGVICFDKNMSLFYSPYHLSVCHEIIHGIDFLKNTMLVGFPEGFSTEKKETWIKLWTSINEYQAICLNPISENHLNEEANLPERLYHKSIEATVILNTCSEVLKEAEHLNYNDCLKSHEALTNPENIQNPKMPDNNNHDSSHPKNDVDPNNTKCTMF